MSAVSMAEEEGNQEITSKMENPSDSASTSPDKPKTSENPPSPPTSPDKPQTSENPPSPPTSPDKPQTSENPPSPPTSPDKPQTSENPPSPRLNSSGKQPVSGTLKERLKKARSSSQPFCSVVKRIKVENEENDQTLSEPGESSKEENCSKAQESLEKKDSEPEKESSEDKNTSESKSLDTGSSSALQKDSTENKTMKQTLKEEKAKLTKQVQEKEDLLRRLKLVKMYRIKSDKREAKKTRNLGTPRALTELEVKLAQSEADKPLQHENDVTELEDLIKKWRRCGQRLLRELQAIMSEGEDEKLTLTELIDYYGIDDNLLRYNRSEEDFTGV